MTWAGVAPDVDGLGAIVDAGNRLLGRPGGGIRQAVEALGFVET